MVRYPVNAITSGSFTGDGEDTQDIICNLPPARVKIFDDDGNFAEMINAKTFAYREVEVSGVFVMKRYELIDGIVAIDGGFRVQNTYLNENGKTYYWEVSL